MGAEALSEDVFVDEFGLLHRGAAWVALSPVQEQLVRLLVGRFGLPVGREELVAAVWAGGEPPRGLDVAMTRLRTKIAGLGLVIHTIRTRGFLLALAS